MLVQPGSIEVVINKYKTSKKYGAIRRKLTKPLETMIRSYMTKNKLGIGSFLFGEAKHSDFLSKMNKLLGYKTGSNLFRKMSVSEELKDLKCTPARRLELSKIMGHAPATQLWYLRDILKIKV